MLNLKCRFLEELKPYRVKRSYAEKGKTCLFPAPNEKIILNQYNIL